MIIEGLTMRGMEERMNTIDREKRGGIFRLKVVIGVL